MTMPSPYIWRHCEPEIVQYGVRGSRRNAPSYCNVEARLVKRGISLNHTTVFRSVQCYVPVIKHRSRPHRKPIHHAYRVDEAYRKRRQIWHDLARVVDSEGDTFDIMRSKT